MIEKIDEDEKEQLNSPSVKVTKAFQRIEKQIVIEQITPSDSEDEDFLLNLQKEQQERELRDKKDI